MTETMTERDGKDVMEYNNETEHMIILEKNTNNPSFVNGEVNVKSEVNYKKDDKGVMEYKHETDLDTGPVQADMDIWEEETNNQSCNDGEIIVKNEADHIWEEETNTPSYGYGENNVKIEVDDKVVDYTNEEANLRTEESIDNFSNINNTNKLQDVTEINDREECENETDHIYKVEAHNKSYKNGEIFVKSDCDDKTIKIKKELCENFNIKVTKESIKAEIDIENTEETDTTINNMEDDTDELTLLSSVFKKSDEMKSKEHWDGEQGFATWSCNETDDNYLSPEQYHLATLQPNAYGSSCELRTAAEPYPLHIEVCNADGETQGTLFDKSHPTKRFFFSGSYSDGHYDVSIPLTAYIPSSTHTNGEIITEDNQEGSKTRTPQKRKLGRPKTSQKTRAEQLREAAQRYRRKKAERKLESAKGHSENLNVNREFVAKYTQEPAKVHIHRYATRYSNRHSARPLSFFTV